MDNSTFHLTHDMLASKGLRLANYIIDFLAVVAVFIILAIGVGFFSVVFGFSVAWVDTMEDWKYNVIFSLLYFCYFMAFESYGGRSLGKLITGTMVVTEDGEKPSPQNIAGRSLCRFIPFDNFSFLGEVGWHDKISSTRVVKKHVYVVRKNQVIELDEIGRNSEVI